jgi:LacI family transcriptional regulator, galactose operon repressor
VNRASERESRYMANRRITAKDVAAHVGVSRTTVSYVLNNVKEANISEETRQRVFAAAEELGYVPDAAAQALASGRTQTIGLMLPASQPHPQASSTHYRIIEGLLEIAQQFGVRLLVDSVRETQNTHSYVNLARNKRIDGLILSDLRVDDQALSQLVNDTFPVVLLGRLPGVKVSSVEFDNRSGARSAVDHLVAQGHTRIGLITHAPATFTGARERISGYRDSLAEHGITFDERLVRYGDYSMESGFAAAMSLLDSGIPPTALFVTYDGVAMGVLAALHKRGVSVPDDIAVVGFDDNPLARFTIPALTTVRLSFEEMGRLAGKMLLDLILNNAKPGRQVLLETELIVRDSSVPSKRSS